MLTKKHVRKGAPNKSRNCLVWFDSCSGALQIVTLFTVLYSLVTGFKIMNKKKKTQVVWQDTLYLYKRLYPFVRPYWKKFFLAVACSVPVSLCAGGIAYLVKPALDDIFLKKDLQMLIVVPIIIIGLYAVRGAFEFGFNYFLGSIGQYITNDIRNALYKHLQTLSMSYFQKNQTGGIITRVTNDVMVLSGALNEGVVDIFKEIVTALGLIAVLYQRDAKLANVAFLILPWMVLPIIRFGRRRWASSPHLFMRPYQAAAS